ncbi:uncharacterized protein LOC124897906 [Capsicum annuum]|uniref:uncharacterized protein LOC124897906 n=1 Tax=Capsicum annuum TaxID=4072 RepID=UPI001FB131EA|nr:uncharacterized protein LOC124897906 [Capsicum annuum]
MTCKLAKEIWDFLKKEYNGDERIRGMKVLNLVREFEMQRMKKSEAIKDYSDRLLLITNRVRILGTELNDNRIVQKAQEQRRMMRREGSIEVALKAKLQLDSSAARGNKRKGKKGNYGNSEATSKKNATATAKNKEGKYPPLSTLWEEKSSTFQVHPEIICKDKHLQQQNEEQIVGQEREEQLFVATCYASKSSSESWLIDSGYTNHMTSDEKLFRELDKSVKSRVKIENGEYLTAG